MAHTSPQSANEPPRFWLEPCVHPLYLRRLAAELKTRGLGMPEFLEGTGVRPARLQHTHRFLTLAETRALVVRAQALLPHPALGLALGLATETSLHGPLGAAVTSAATVSMALDVLERFGAVRQRLVTLAIEQWAEHREITLHFQERIPLGDMRVYLLSNIAGAIQHLLTSALGQRLPSGFSVSWPFPCPHAEAAELYREAFPESIWDAEELVMRFPMALLAEPLLASDLRAHGRAVQECRHESRFLDMGSTEIRLRARLAESQGGFPKLKDVAAEWDVSPRTLIRWLNDDDTSFQRVLDETRAEVACLLLDQTTQSINEIAEALGFADASNFSRTFRRWQGLSPREYRQRRTSAQQAAEKP